MKLDQKTIADKLVEKGAVSPCSRCGNQSFSIVSEYYSKVYLSKEDEPPGSLIFGGPTIPVAIVACSKCGAITFHSLIAIGLMDAPNEDSSHEKDSSKKETGNIGKDGKC